MKRWVSKEKKDNSIFIHVNDLTCITGILKFNFAVLWQMNGKDSKKVRQTCLISDEY